MPDEERPAPKPLPELPPIGWKDVACVGPIIANTIYSLAGRALTTLLIGTHPTLLSALRGTFTSMMVSGAFARAGLIPLWLAFLAPIPYLMFDDPFIYWSGRYGRPLLDYLEASTPAWRKQIERAERAVKRFNVAAIIVGNFPLNPLPMITIVMFLAGDTAMNFALFLFADFISLLINTVFWVGMGWIIGKPAQDVAVAIAGYAGPITLATIGIIIVMVILSTRKTMKQMREQYGDDWYNKTGDK